MKADVAFAPKLSIPRWVPKTVAQFVREEYAVEVLNIYGAKIHVSEHSDGSYGDKAWGPVSEHSDDEDYIAYVLHLAAQDEVRAAYVDIVRDDLEGIAECYRSLVSDPRMRTVWHELSRQRKGGGFLYPALPQTAADANKRQAMAMVELIELARKCCYVAAPLTRAKAERLHRTYLAQAEALQATGIAILIQRPSAESDLLSEPVTIAALRAKYHPNFEPAAKLFAAVETLKDYAHALHRGQPSLPVRDRNARARLVALMMSHKFQALFGQPMYSQTATIVSVVLDRQIDPRTVRFWCTSYPAVKPQKIGP
jgi:hypothetical protein